MCNVSVNYLSALFARLEGLYCLLCLFDCLMSIVVLIVSTVVIHSGGVDEGNIDCEQLTDYGICWFPID